MKHGGCVVSDYRVVNKQIQNVPGILPDFEAEMDRLPGASALATMGLLQG